MSVPKDLCGVVISGGDFSKEDADAILSMKKPYYVIAADKGMENAASYGIKPDAVIGDFDSSSKASVDRLSSLEKDGEIEVIRLSPMKDDTDTEAALRLALSRCTGDIYIFGGIGTRIDHLLGNIHILLIADEAKRSAYLMNKNNRIRLLSGPITIKKNELFGKYVSFFPISSDVFGLSLRGFLYELNDAKLSYGTSLGCSNELHGDIGEVDFSQGRLLMIESRD